MRVSILEIDTFDNCFAKHHLMFHHPKSFRTGWDTIQENSLRLSYCEFNAYGMEDSGDLLQKAADVFSLLNPCFYFIRTICRQKVFIARNDKKV